MSLKVNTLAWTLLGAALCAPAVVGAAAAREGALTITRLDSQDWQVTLSAGGDGAEFSGVLESSAPFLTSGVTGGEAADAATPATPTSLGIRLVAEAGDADTVTFSVPSGTKLCLRDTGSVNVALFRGADAASGQRVRAPVPMGGADACSSTDGGVAPASSTFATADTTSPLTTDFGATTDSTLVPLATTAAGARKFHPGHYIALMRGQDSHSVMAASMKAGVKGFMKRYTWRQLEPRSGSYDFSEIQSDLAWCQSYGMKLVVMVEDKTFTLERPTPAYLDTLTPRNRAGGYTVVRWNPTVVSRLQALMKALGRFDSNAAFEGVALQETSLGFDDATLKAHGYTPEKYRDAYIAVLTTAGNAMPTSRSFFFMNFFARNQKYIASIANATYSKGVAMGGPDVLPDNKALQSKTYPLYDQFQYKMPLFGQVESMCYWHEHATSGYSTKYWTMPELFKFARDEMHVDYMFWVRVTRSKYANSYDWTDALPVVAKNVTFNR